MAFFRKTTGPRVAVHVHLNARVQPMHRGEVYEDPLELMMKRSLRGSEITGGGSVFTPETGVESCDIELEVVGDGNIAAQLIIDTLEDCGAPRGSWLTVGEAGPISFGKTAGLALSLNGKDLPVEVYKSNDVNELIGALLAELDGVAKLQSWWESSEWTTLFFYGKDEARTRSILVSAATKFPLAEGSKVEMIA